MNKNIFRFLTVLFALSAYSLSYSQHSISVWTGGGLSALNAKVSSDFNKENKIRYNLGVGYTYDFNSKLSLNAGLEYIRYASKISSGTISDSYIANDGEEDFLFSYEVDYTEDISSGSLSLPVTVQYLFPIGIGNIYAAGGLKWGLLNKVNSTNTYNNLIATGTYENYDYTFTDLNHQGFGVFKDNSNPDKYSMKMSVAMTLEGGLQWELSDKLKLDSGLYFDLGFNNINKHSDSNYYIEYDHHGLDGGSLANNSALSSMFSDGNSFVNKLKPMCFGIKVKLYYSLSEKSSGSAPTNYRW